MIFFNCLSVGVSIRNASLTIISDSTIYPALRLQKIMSPLDTISSSPFIKCVYLSTKSVLRNLSNSFKWWPEMLITILICIFFGREWYNVIWDSCGPVINHWIEIQLIHAYKFCVKCLSATTKRQQTVRRIKLVKRECQQRKSVFVIVTHQMCKTFHEPLMELASHVSPEQNRGTINYYTHFLKLILPSLLLSPIQKSILWLVYFGYFDHLSAETRDKQNKKWVDQTKGDRGNVKRKEDYFEISWT